MLTAALSLASHGKLIFPLQVRGKIPLTTHGCKDATTDQATLTRWWEQQWPDANIGLATGPASGVFVLDVDGEEGEASLRALEAEHGALPATAESLTGGGGRHLFFKWPQSGVVKNSAGKLGACLDVRGEGGYVVMPPSVHPSGRKYVWSVDSGDQIVPAPAWLLHLIANPQGKRPTPVSEWRSLMKGVPEGQRNQSLARIAGKLLRSRIDPFMALELCLAWNETRCVPPLPHDEVTQTVNSIAGRELARRGA